jgi:hypothetical protein
MESDRFARMLMSRMSSDLDECRRHDLRQIAVLSAPKHGAESAACLPNPMPGTSPSVTDVVVTQKRKAAHFYETLDEVPSDISASIMRVGVLPFYLPRAFISGPTESHAARLAAETEDNDTYVAEAVARARSPVWIAVGVDARHGEITDFAGRRKPRERLADAGARELYEESACLFNVMPQALQQSRCVTDGVMCVIFLQVSPRAANGFPDRLPQNFAAARSACAARGAHAAVLGNSTMYWQPAGTLVALSRLGPTLPSDAPLNASSIGVPPWMPRTAAALGSFNPLVYNVLRRIVVSVSRRVNLTERLAAALPAEPPFAQLRWTMGAAACEDPD